MPRSAAASCGSGRTTVPAAAADRAGTVTVRSVGMIARAVMTVTREHLNAGGVCQGGALFTLADLAVAAVMNGGGRLTLSVQSSITFVRPAVEGDVLTAEAVETAPHHKLPYLEVKITNQRSELVSAFTCTAYRKQQELKTE